MNKVWACLEIWIILHSFKAVNNTYSSYMLTVLTTIIHYWFFFMKKGIFLLYIVELSANILWKKLQIALGIVYIRQEYPCNDRLEML